MIQTTERTTYREEVMALVTERGPMPANEIAARLEIPFNDAAYCTSHLVAHGFLHRDESGTVANWCPWPRAGF
jgi:DNA-binding IclR family transcriptional regulator